MWPVIYLLYIAVGCGSLMVGAGLLWPGIINQGAAVRWAPMVLGALLGVGLAERSRRSGQLLGRRPQRRR